MLATTPSMASPDAVDLHLLALDPIRSLRTVLRSCDRYARLDPKVREATTLLGDRLGELPGADDVDDVLAPLWWLEIRGQLMTPAGVQLLQRLLGDGELVLRTVDDALARSMNLDVLSSVVSVVRQDAHDDSALATRLRAAQHELSRVRDALPEDNPAIGIGVGAAALLLAAGAAAGYLLFKSLHHHAEGS